MKTIVGRAPDLEAADESFGAGDFEQAATMKTGASKQKMKDRNREVIPFP